ncbi:hypothetical protein WG29040_23265 [Pseudomonas sp. PAMC 29040]|uniref:hypothetical protein n=1 Tax=Pseudomonas sp. PAMC 29040 TaxID=2498450 RepID=UPI000FC19595|nr:hypothetical protein [Pseudomonas sp. PAMC 29040]RUT30861.1 hypothetical protein WG29040_23265 [Pseudomonas sp. PAMC 29040]
MPAYTRNEKLLYLNQARRKVLAIAKANRPYIDRAEEHARAYAEALYDVDAITETERVTLQDDARKTAEDRVRYFNAATQV